jgi:hypothetical protein
MNRHRIAAFTVAALVGLGGGAALGQGSGPQQTPAQHASMLADAVDASGIDSARRMVSFVRVVGFVWTEKDQHVPYPRLVIRDLANGHVVGETIGTEVGEFRFEGLSAGAYVIELLDESDRVLAVSQMLTVVAGDTVGTFIRVSGSIRSGLIFGAGSSVFESAAAARVGGAGGGNPASSER